MNTLIIDAKSGTSGAGRGAKVDNLYCEVNENIKAYGVASPPAHTGDRGAAYLRFRRQDRIEFHTASGSDEQRNPCDSLRFFEKGSVPMRK